MYFSKNIEVTQLFFSSCHFSVSPLMSLNAVEIICIGLSHVNLNSWVETMDICNELKLHYIRSNSNCISVVTHFSFLLCYHGTLSPKLWFIVTFDLFRITFFFYLLILLTWQRYLYAVIYLDIDFSCSYQSFYIDLYILFHNQVDVCSDLF